MSRVRIPSIAQFSRPMSTLEALLLGIIQGLTEFLPVSSSGHLTLTQSLLGLKHLDQLILFNLVCHLGTLCSIFCIFYQPILSLFKTDRTQLFQLILGTLPLFPLLIILKPIKTLFDSPQYLGYFFLTTAAILWIGQRFSSTVSLETLKARKWRDPLIIGMFQAVAILPGVSRSGTTISGARLIGWDFQKAVRFSFLLAIPAILGGTVLEAGQLILNHEKYPHVDLGIAQYGIAFIAAFIMGYLSLRWLTSIGSGKKFIYFVWYCLLIGFFSLWYFNLGFN